MRSTAAETELYCRLDGVCLPRWSYLFLYAVLAGIFVAFASAASVGLGAHADDPGVRRVLSSVIFPAGLILSVVSGAELFTGRVMLLTPIFTKQNSLSCTIRYWSYVYLGNLAGSLFVVILLYFGGSFNYLDNRFGQFLIQNAATKAGYGIFQMFILGLACNLLVCMGVWAANKAGAIVDKVLIIYFPVFIFVLLGLENSIANMFTLPAGLLALTDRGIAQTFSAAGIDTAALTVLNVLKNLLFVSLGNLVGGALLSIIDHKTFIDPEHDTLRRR